MTFRSQMRSDWDERARSNAIRYIGDEDEDIEAFYERGSRLVASNLAPVLKQLEFDPGGGRVLDIGCGMGRLFPGLENLGFEEIWGLDASAEMITRGEEMCPVRSAHFVVGTGDDLAPLEDNYFDFCHSYVVFEHIPTSEIIWRYFEEMERILAPGGVFAILLRRFT